MVTWQLVVFAIIPLVALLSSILYTGYAAYRLRDWRPLVFLLVLVAMSTHQINEIATVLGTGSPAPVTGFGEYPETIANLAASSSVILLLRLVSRERTLREDLAAQVELERQLREENQRLEEFVSVVSHDIRNPLQVARGKVRLAREESDSAQLSDAADALDRMDNLVDDLLTLAREGERIGDVEVVNLGELCTDCLETVRTRDATLRIDTEQRICADRNRLRQLIENLLRNAVEHSDGSVAVTVGALADGFYVEDDGPGIPPEERDDVFERGYSTRSDGTGFGLEIVDQIATAHGWDVRVTNGSDGGARFEITGVELPE